tara:strand:+ start:17737 stop:18267 length:531 start_codon:yes stop_codon:yes gene_type:complete
MDNYTPPRSTPHNSRSGSSNSDNSINNIIQRFRRQIRVRPGSAAIRQRVSDNASPLVRHHEHVRSRLKPLIYRPIPEPKQIIEKKIIWKKINLPDNKNNRQDIITFKNLKSGDKVIRLANHKFIKQSTLKNLIKSQWNKNYSIKQLYSLRNQNRLFKIHPLRKNNKRESIEFVKFK